MAKWCQNIIKLFWDVDIVELFKAGAHIHVYQNNNLQPKSTTVNLWTHSDCFFFSIIVFKS